MTTSKKIFFLKSVKVTYILREGKCKRQKIRIFDSITYGISEVVGTSKITLFASLPIPRVKN